MNTLPEDIQNKIYKMAHQMKLMEVMSELISEFDYMCFLKAKKDYQIYINYTRDICPHRLINYHRERHYHASHVLRFHKEYRSHDNDNYDSDESSDESSEDESDN